MMPDDHPILIKYPQQKTTIARLSRAHAAFADICDDYRLIIEEIAAGPEVAGGRHDPAKTELLRIRGELEEEVMRWLQNNG